MDASLNVASYNIHKGLSQFNRRLTVHEMRERLGALGTDIVFLQEVQHSHSQRASRFQHWPSQPQHEFLAGHIYTEFAYGKNCVYDTGHHGNAILSRHKILSWENEDISAHAYESRGMLHCEIEVPGIASPVHCINVHLALNEGGRRRQLAQIAARVHKMVPDGAPLILAGDFNDWRMRACTFFKGELGLAEVFETHHGKPARSYPSILPMFQLDRIYVRGFSIDTAHVHTGNAWHRISDHAALSAKLHLAG
ncbi:endonuclease/exonuclease/phosphatase family protein [Thiobacillus denitrificans]|jgi:endonuclease/exonuclease/phosphatase family metal-dependent hydrolase|uniref:endonuclease/exonuclease/phosphatase family protein n=1 Tax=Thiobacillus denitrificans TaxID=36861 RepID=UPI00036FDD09|nr:endonuclease/exonuclease/phosphatase family protein [Thiobacillus denitrificans]